MADDATEPQMELKIVSQVDEEMAAAEHAQRERLKQFIAQFDMRAIPACDEGMALLLAFSEAHPGAYELARQRSFNVTDTMFGILPRWKAFAKHVSSCPNCNER